VRTEKVEVVDAKAEERDERDGVEVDTNLPEVEREWSTGPLDRRVEDAMFSGSSYNWYQTL
jgi:hypothetical protein